MTDRRDVTAVGDTVTGMLLVGATALMSRLSALWAVTGGLFIVANNAPRAWAYVQERKGYLSKSEDMNGGT